MDHAVFLVFKEVDNEDISSDCIPYDGEGKDFLQVICEMENVLLQLKSNMGEYGAQEMKNKIDIMRACMNSITEPFTFARPSPIVLPSKGSVLSIQVNVQRTRMGHGRSSKEKATTEEDKTLRKIRPTLTPPTHKLVSTSKRKRTIFPRISKVHSDACFTRTMIEKDDTIVSCRNCNRQLKCT